MISPKEAPHAQVIHGKLANLSDALEKAARLAATKELLRVVKEPGWTTPAEFALMMIAVDSLQAHVDAIAKALPELLKAAHLVTAAKV